MAFIKSHLVSLVCGVVALGAIVALAMGMMSDRVEQTMQEQIEVAGQLSSLAGRAQNQETIEAAQRHREQFQSEYNTALEELHRVNQREPIIAGVFPSTGGNQTLAFRFIDEYRTAFQQMEAALGAGTRPTEEEIAEARTNIEERLRMEQATEGEGSDPLFDGGEDGRSNRPAAPGGNPYGGGPGGNPYGGGPYGGGPGRGNPYDGGPGGGNPYGGTAPRGGRVNVDETKPENNPLLVAAINKARNTRVYLDPGAFHVTDIIARDTAPNVDELWFAQQSLWIQQDVVKAIAGLNERFAQNLDEGQANVMNLPVKRIEYVRVNGYKLEEGALSFPPSVEVGDTQGGGRGPAVLESLPSSFTDRVSDDEFDVIHFSTQLWVDTRYLNQVVDAICAQNLYQCVDLDLVAVSPANAPEGYVFGTAPVAQLTMDFEGYFARAVYKQWMPEDVVQRLGGESEQQGRRRR